MKTKIAILAALVLSACGTVTQVPPQFYRAQGQADQLAMSDRTDVKCTVYVAGERAANLVMVP
ncbi:hypothetical protein [Pandoraea norimbergensis]|uniref:Uncharacterized protein n=1 Tax=Pandoraea norimbergensis TaxID=93219 RepID=A0ABN4JMG0_9BURK|nr:hypothetical protein [Pandoraea norimbergensis]ALS61848.1 hypothetical protein AT302_20770 [Pandoraea norimbergensis]